MASEVTCPDCGHSNPGSEAFCSHCREDLTPGPQPLTKVCSSCHGNVAILETACPRCGSEEFSTPRDPEPPKGHWTKTWRFLWTTITVRKGRKYDFAKISYSSPFFGHDSETRLSRRYWYFWQLTGLVMLALLILETTCLYWEYRNPLGIPIIVVLLVPFVLLCALFIWLNFIPPGRT